MTNNIDLPASKVQNGWASCSKCQGMYFAGFPDFKGVCPAGGQHEHTNSFTYAMPHDLPPTANVQSEWRSCPRCQGLFFGPLQGTCPKGGAHSADGSFNYGLRVEPPVSADTHVFDSGPLSSNLALGGSVHIVTRQNGNFTFHADAHDSGFDNIDYVVSAVLMTTSGIAFTFQHAGHTEGTSAGLPFGTPNRDDHFDSGGTNPAIGTEWLGIHHGGRLIASIDGKDTLVQGVEGMIGDLIKQAAAELGKAAAAAIIALVV